MLSKLYFYLVLVCLVFSVINAENEKEKHANDHAKNRNHNEAHPKLRAHSKNRAAENSHEHQKDRHHLDRAHAAHDHQKARNAHERSHQHQVRTHFGAHQAKTRDGEQSTNQQQENENVAAATFRPDSSNSQSETGPTLVGDGPPGKAQLSPPNRPYIPPFCAQSLARYYRGFVLLVAANIRGDPSVKVSLIVAQELLNSRNSQDLETRIKEVFERQNYNELTVTAELKFLINKTNVESGDLQTLNVAAICSHSTVTIDVQAFFAYIKKETVDIITAAQSTVFTTNCPTVDTTTTPPTGMDTPPPSTPMPIQSGESAPTEVQNGGDQVDSNEQDSANAVDDSNQAPPPGADRHASHHQLSRHGHQQHSNRNKEAQKSRHAHKDRSQHQHHNERAANHHEHKARASAHHEHKDRHQAHKERAHHQNRNHGKDHSKERSHEKTQ